MAEVPPYFLANRPGNRKVSCGQAVRAMVLNALGLSGRGLYLMPEYMQTMRRFVQVLEGVDILIIRRSHQTIRRQILNLSPVREQIIRLFGPHVHTCYLLDPYREHT